jgi:hypothetical protein
MTYSEQDDFARFDLSSVGKKTSGLRVDVDDDATGWAFALVELLVLERVQNALALLAQAFTKHTKERRQKKR